MNVKRFTARTSRDALALVRQSFGQDAVVISTRPCAEGVEVLAMAPDSVQHFERVAVAATPQPAAKTPNAASSANAARPSTRPAVRPKATAADTVEQDVQRLSMSTLSFQDYVRERMLKRRQAELSREAQAEETPARPVTRQAEAAPSRAALRPAEQPVVARPPVHPTYTDLASPEPRVDAAQYREATLGGAHEHAGYIDVPTLRSPASAPLTLSDPVPQRDQLEMMNELRSMRGLIEQRFGALAFMEKLQRQPRQALLSQKLLDHGFSPALIRKLMDGLPDDVDEATWAADVLARNLGNADTDMPLEEQGGVYAMIGSTGVGKTTSTAKLAAAFAARHGASNLGLITLDAYRVAAHEQLRTYGRILGVPVHTAHDRASLEDLLDLLSGKKMVLIDTAGTAQRDARTRELLEMLSHRSINRLLVVNAAAQGETIEDVLVSYRAATCKGVVLSKLDEAVKLGPALDALIRHRQKVLAVANGQRVPEDWHRLSSQALVQRALRGNTNPAWRLDAGDVNLVFAGLPGAVPAAAGALHA